MTNDRKLLLGLIGDSIAASSSPLLHCLAGQQAGLEVRYEKLVPRDLGLDFEALLTQCRQRGFRGVNVTHPYKERAAAMVTTKDPLVRAMGAVNTVCFENGEAIGFNTDYTGFIAAYKGVRQQPPQGPVLMIGTGGVGRAIAFGLARLKAPELRLVDRDPARADALAAILRKAAPELRIITGTEAEPLAIGCEGLVNCTPVGMIGYEGTPLAAKAMPGAAWVFDAVYTPRDTQFMRDAMAAGLAQISGWDLFFHQGVHAWERFSGHRVDEALLHDALDRANA